MSYKVDRRPDHNKYDPNSQEYRDQRLKDWNARSMSSASDFDFGQYDLHMKDGDGTHISLAEMDYIRDNNKDEHGQERFQDNFNALKAQKDAGAIFGTKAEQRYQEYYEKNDRINKAQADMTKISGLPSHLDPADPTVRKAFGGEGWGEQDQARYDKLIAAQAKERAQNHQQNSTNIKNTQEQNVTQNNDQTSTVDGDNNYVYQQQDNSVRNYGGDNRSFVYNDNGKGKGLSTPASQATMAGFYAPDDSPGATASRLDQHVTMNRDNQKKYKNTSHIAEGAINRAMKNTYIDPRKLDERIASRSQYHKDQSKIFGAAIFGDIYGLEAPTWKSSTPAKKMERPDFEKMYDTYTDF